MSDSLPPLLLSGLSWADAPATPTVVTYSFAADGMTRSGRVLSNVEWAAFSTAQRASTQQALAAWEAVSGLTFLEVPDSGGGAGSGLRFRLQSFASLTILGEASGPGDGEVALSQALFRGDSLAPSATRIGFTTLLHEIGHAIGLTHPASGGNQDSLDWTVLATARGALGLPFGPRPLDVEAVQWLYGTPAQKGAEGLVWSFDDAWQAVRGIGTAGDDLLRAPAHGSVLDGGPGGQDTLLGGAGIDTAVVHAARASAALDLGHGQVATSAGVLTLSSIEALEFEDGQLVIGAEHTVAKVWRLYQAALDRLPDQPGLMDWVGVLDHGTWTLAQVAQAFLDSPEFTGRFGRLSNGKFARLLVDHVGGGDPAEIKAMLAAGVTRADVLLAVAEGEAGRAKVAPQLAGGLWVHVQEGASAARLHQLAFGTLPVEPEWRVTVEQLLAGMSLKTAAGSLVEGKHFQDTYGAADAVGLLPVLLENGLGRPPGDSEASAWEARILAEHLDLPGVLAGLVQDSAVMANLRTTTEHSIAFL